MPESSKIIVSAGVTRKCSIARQYPSGSGFCFSTSSPVTIKPNHSRTPKCSSTSVAFCLLPVVWCAPIIGDQCNYFIGHFFGRRIIQSGKVKALTPERLAKTEGMIEKWGPLAVFLGRFFPFIRTFMPFISGISGMRWSRFTPFSVLGGLCWSTLFTLLGYFFGNIPAVQDHFELVIVLILLVSLAPTIIGLLKAKFGKKKPAKVTDAQLDVMEDGIKNLDK